MRRKKRVKIRIRCMKRVKIINPPKMGFGRNKFISAAY